MTHLLLRSEALLHDEEVIWTAAACRRSCRPRQAAAVKAVPRHRTPKGGMNDTSSSPIGGATSRRGGDLDCGALPPLLQAAASRGRESGAKAPHSKGRNE